MNRDAGGDALSVARRLGGTYGGCRDPHVIQLDDGTFVAYWVARVQEKFGDNLVCVAASMSHDLLHWQESRAGVHHEGLAVRRGADA